MSLTLNLEPIINEAIDKKLIEMDIQGQVKELLEDVAKNASKVLVVKLGEEGEEKRFPLVHKQFEQLLSVTTLQGMNPLLTGGAGLSKTTAVMQVSEALGLDFTSISFSNQTTKTDLYGFVDANGNYRRSAFVDAFENGKLFLADEMDACSANVLVLLNSAIENGFLTTADDRTIYMHENFRIVGTANTNLRGSKDGFTARNKLDSATINRFSMIEWELDEDLEQKITDNDAWLKIVRKIRKNAEDNLEGVVITPRSSYKGAKLLKHGVDIDDVINMVVLQAVSDDDKEVMMKGITENMKAQATKHMKGTEPKEEDEYERKMALADEIEKAEDLDKEFEVDETIEDDVKTFKEAGYDDDEEEDDEDLYKW